MISGCGVQFDDHCHRCSGLGSPRHPYHWECCISHLFQNLRLNSVFRLPSYGVLHSEGLVSPHLAHHSTDLVILANVNTPVHYFVNFNSSPFIPVYQSCCESYFLSQKLFCIGVLTYGERSFILCTVGWAEQFSPHRPLDSQR